MEQILQAFDWVILKMVPVGHVLTASMEAVVWIAAIVFAATYAWFFFLSFTVEFVDYVQARKAARKQEPKEFTIYREGKFYFFPVYFIEDVDGLGNSSVTAKNVKLSWVLYLLSFSTSVILYPLFDTLEVLRLGKFEGHQPIKDAKDLPEPIKVLR